VNQIELHPWCQQRDVVAFCNAHQIAVVAYSPLTKGLKLGDPGLTTMAREVRRSPAQSSCAGHYKRASSQFRNRQRKS